MASVVKEVLVNAPVEKVYEFWRNFENFPRFMENIESISVTGPDESHWKSKGPLGKTIAWDAKTISVQENKKIAWQSTGGDIETHGAVTFETVGEQTKVTVGLEYTPPGGVIGEAVAKLFSNPEAQLEEDLGRFKSVAESAGFAQGMTGGEPAVGEGSYTNTVQTDQRGGATVTGSGSGVDQNGETRATN